MNSDDRTLRSWELWVADHAAPIFVAVAVAIIAGAIAIFFVFLNQGEVEHQVNVLRPQVTRVNKAICDKQSLDHSQRAERCAERIRVGLVNCRHNSRCRAAFLALLTYPPPAKPSSSPAATTVPSSKGVMPQQPSNHGHQQPGPGSPGHHGGNGQEAPPAASPGPSPAPGGSATPEASPPAETPGNGAQGGSTSGVGVEVCAELVNTCVGAEVGAGR